MRTRRQFIKGIGTLGGALMVQLNRVMPAAAARNVAPPSDGEEYAGFILLPDESPLPSHVVPPRLGIPIFCGVGVGRGGPDPTVASEYLDTSASLALAVPFQVRVLGIVPNNYRESSIVIVRHNTGEVYSVAVNYDVYNANNDNWESALQVIAMPDFYRPYPVWASNPVVSNGPSVVLQKAGFLPSPGLVMPSPSGYVLLWIEHDVLYTVIAEHYPTLDEMLTLVQSLVVLSPI